MPTNDDRRRPLTFDEWVTARDRMRRAGFHGSVHEWMFTQRGGFARMSLAARDLEGKFVQLGRSLALGMQRVIAAPSPLKAKP